MNPMWKGLTSYAYGTGSSSLPNVKPFGYALRDMSGGERRESKHSTGDDN